jgi:hypothetical protein
MIKGLQTAKDMAIERAGRTKDTICIVQIGDDEYVLWRESNLISLPFVYTYYKVIQRIKINDFRR